MKNIIFCLLFLFGISSPGRAAGYFPERPQNSNNPGKETAKNLQDDEIGLDLFCLRKSYPQITGVEQNGGNISLILKNGQTVAYDAAKAGDNFNNASIRETMKQIYPLEPARPDFMDAYSPGRKRSQKFMEALYGHNSSEVQKNLVSLRFGGKNIRLAGEAARSFSNVLQQLEKLRASDPLLRPFLEPGGGFCWRKISGEDRLSPHAFGIALDMGIKVAPYWRWSKINPHPGQKTYPAIIVKLMEDNGFIWGGKWHEYDLMHFEYRPELICKAGILARKNYKNAACGSVFIRRRRL